MFVLFYLEWRLALVTLIIVPGIVAIANYFAGKLRALSHQSMEREANVTRAAQESLTATLLVKAFSSERRTVEV